MALHDRPQPERGAKPAFRASERHLALLEATPDAMIVVDESGSLWLANEQAAKLFGYGREELLRLRVEDLIPESLRHRHRDTRTAYAEDPHARAMGSGLECPVIHSDGRSIPAEISLSPVTIEGEAFVIAAIRDATERKQTQAKLVAAAGQQRMIAQLGLQSLGYDGGLHDFLTLVCQRLREALGVDFTKVLELEPAGQKLLLRAGAGWREDYVGTTRIGTGRNSLAGFTLASDSPIVVADASNEDRFRIPQFLLEHAITSSLTCIIYVRDTAYGVLGVDSIAPRSFDDSDIDLLQVVANLIGQVVDRDRARIQLRRTELERERLLSERSTELEALREEFDLFLESLAHDLRTPLRGIDGYSHILQEEKAGAGDASSRRYLERIRSSAQRLGAQMDDLLMLSKVSRIVPRFEEVDLIDLAREIIAELRRGSPSRQVEIRLPTSLTAIADSYLTRLALASILSNAWKFTSGKDVARVEVGALNAEQEGPSSDAKSTFFVRDNGAGFNPAFSGKLYRPFGRLHRYDEFEGRGIGLALAQRALARQGGRIWAESSPGQGATFYFQPSRTFA